MYLFLKFISCIRWLFFVFWFFWMTRIVFGFLPKLGSKRVQNFKYLEIALSQKLKTKIFWNLTRSLNQGFGCALIKVFKICPKMPQKFQLFWKYGIFQGHRVTLKLEISHLFLMITRIKFKYSSKFAINLNIKPKFL